MKNIIQIPIKVLSGGGGCKIYYKYSRLLLGLFCGFEIPLNVFGKGLSIAHRGPIVVNPNVKVGDNCRIHICVNIGTNIGVPDEAPVLGNNIYIAPGAKLYGNIHIADGIVIGCNSVVNKSFEEPNITIAGSPAKKIGGLGRLELEERNKKRSKGTV